MALKRTKDVGEETLRVLKEENTTLKKENGLLRRFQELLEREKKVLTLDNQRLRQELIDTKSKHEQMELENRQLGSETQDVADELGLNSWKDVPGYIENVGHWKDGVYDT